MFFCGLIFAFSSQMQKLNRKILVYLTCIYMWILRVHSLLNKPRGQIPVTYTKQIGNPYTILFPFLFHLFDFLIRNSFTRFLNWWQRYYVSRNRYNEMVQHILLYSHEMNSTGQLYNNFCPNESDFFSCWVFFNFSALLFSVTYIIIVKLSTMITRVYVLNMIIVLKMRVSS